MDIDEIHAALKEAKKGRQVARYTEELKRAVVVCVEEQVRTGTNRTEAIRRAGVSWSSFHRWAAELDEKPAVLVPVRVRQPEERTPPQPQRYVTLVSPTGWRIEGLTAEAAVALLGGLP